MTKLAMRVCAVGLWTVLGCAGQEPATETADTTESAGSEAAVVEGGDQASAEPVEAVKPDQDKLIAHFKEHVQYPIDRTNVLAACAKTTEFTEGEKAWVEQNLPEGDYGSSDELVQAMGL